MKQIISYIHNHFIIYTSKWFIVPYLLFLGVIISFNYLFKLDGKLFSASSTFPIRFLIYLLLYGAGYFFTWRWLSVFDSNQKKIPVKGIILSLILISVLAIEKSSPLHLRITNISSLYPYAHFLGKIAKQLSLPIIILIGGFFLLKFKLIRKDSFGLRVIDFLPYFKILSFLLPLVFFVSFAPQFSSFYPKYKTSLAVFVSNIPELYFVGAYELAYAINLISLEVFIHGLLVLGMFKYLGKGCIYPAVTVYCFYHFGKPVMECSMSIVGGYLLGVISLYTRSVLGGSIIHVGIAWMMEAAAWMQHNYFPDH